MTDELPAVEARLHPDWDGALDRYVRSLFHTVHAELLAEGMDGHRASVVALRIVRQSFLVRIGVPQGKAAAALGISPRTAAYDAKRARGVLNDARWAALGRLAPIPQPADRIKLKDGPRRRLPSLNGIER